MSRLRSPASCPFKGLWTGLSAVRGLLASSRAAVSTWKQPCLLPHLPASLFHYHVTALHFYKFPEEAALGVKGQGQTLLHQAGWSCDMAKWAVLLQGHRQ